MVNRETALNGIALLALLLLPIIASSMGEVFYVNLASRIALIAMAATGLNLALGFGGLVSLGHAAFFGLGGYVAGVAAHHAFDGSDFAGFLPGTTSMPVIWIFAMLLTGIVGAGIGWISLRTKGVYFIMITLAFAQMIYYFAISFSTYGGEDGLPIYVRNEFPGLDSMDPLVFFFLCFVLLAIVLFITMRIMGSRFGAALTMAHANEQRLETAGIEVFPVRMIAFILSGMIVGLAGALYADLNGFVGPSMLSWHRSGELIVIVILGGVARHFGPLIGAMVFILLETVLGGLTEYWQFFLGLALLVVVLFGKGGVIGLIAGRKHHV